jgi:hypothetical protein
MNPPRLFATLATLHGPRRPRESPIGAWATFDRLKNARASDRAGAGTRTAGKKCLGASQVRFLRHDSGVRWWRKTEPLKASLQGFDAPSAHRRPGYSSSGCTPAEPDSASPGAGSLAEHLSDHKACGRQVGSLGMTPKRITCANELAGMTRRRREVRTPLKKVQKTKTGVPVESLLTSFFL